MTASRRATLALIACVLWMIGVEIAPRVYLACHLLAEASGHAADEPTARIDADAPAAARHTHAEQRLAPAHPRAHELITSELGTLAPPPPPIGIVPVDRRVTELPDENIATLIAASTPTAAARGPPSAPAARLVIRSVHRG